MMAKEWIRTHCARFDHGGCGLKVLVEDGRPVRVEPDPEDPFSVGYSCRKGMAAIERINSPERLTQPLERRGKRGAGEWEVISWEEALDTLATRFAETRDRFGPEALAFAQGAPKGLEFFVLLRFANLLGTPNVAAAQHVCHMPREQMAMATCGFFPVADLENPTRCVLIWGSNPLNTNEEGVLGSHLMGCLKQGPSLIVIDPVKTELARRADIWLQIRPGSDDLLALGFLHVLIEEKLYDSDFVEKWTTGFDDLREAVKPYTPERVSEGTWVPREKIIAAARLYGQSRPAVLQWGNAVEHTTNSSQTCRSLVLLMALTGNLEAPGGNIRCQAPKLKRLAEFIRLDQFPDRSSKLLNRPFGLIPRLITVPNWVLMRSIIDQTPYPVRSLYIQGTNPLVSYAQVEEVHRALSSLDFLAVADQVMTPTAAMADLVLPVATNLEFNDIGHYGLPHGYVLARPKAVEPRGECRPDLEILNEWAKRMGFAEHFWNDPMEPLEEILGPSGLTYKEFAAKGVLRGPKSYYTYREKGFSTPSGKVELRSSLMGKWGYAPLPFAESPREPGKDFPLLLTSTKPKEFFHSAYRHLPSLRERHPMPCVRIHPETAESIGIEDGMQVKIETASGSIVQTARLFDGISPGVVVGDYGWWFPERGEASLFGWKESNINCLTQSDGTFDPVMGTTQMRAIPCRVKPAVR
jgi:anaerobic selenocysteine-containing dehydrogenase